MSDLSWLETAKPVETSFQKSSRGRQPGKNPMEAHVVASYGAPQPLSLEIPADKAHNVERLIRRAGTAHGWKMSVQVTAKHPDQATSADVIALRELPELEAGTDVWIAWHATDKPAEKDAPAATPAKSDAPADPFAGTPAVSNPTPNGESTKATTAKAKTPAKA